MTSSTDIPDAADVDRTSPEESLLEASSEVVVSAHASMDEGVGEVPTNGASGGSNGASDSSPHGSETPAALLVTTDQQVSGNQEPGATLAKTTKAAPKNGKLPASSNVERAVPPDSVPTVPAQRTSEAVKKPARKSTEPAAKADGKAPVKSILAPPKSISARSRSAGAGSKQAGSSAPDVVPPAKPDANAVAAANGSALRTDSAPQPAKLRGLNYDPALADKAVQAKNLLTDRRFLKMAKTLMRFSLECCADKVLTSRREDEQGTRRMRARRLREALCDLGPTFIKLGQFLSVRRDCLSQEMADELAVLQDRVPPFAFDLVRKSITSELGASPQDLFAEFDEKPIASASIGQVHRAVLKDGRPVVVKVQRPDLANRFYQDLGCMRLLAKWGLLIKPEGQWQSWLELSDEFGRNLFQEINYLQEGRNADRVRTMLKDHEDIRIPRVYWKYTGRRVLTLEYLPGTKVDRIEVLERQGVNLSKIGNQLVSCYLEMVLMHGFFHADPHAGNISIDSDGKIILYDFGMIGEISDEQREALTGCISSVIQKDTEQLIKNLKLLGIVKPDAQTGPIMRTVQPFIDYYAGKSVKDLDFTHLESDIDRITDDKALMLPPTLAYVLRAGTSLEGIARTLRPNFSFVEAAKPALKKWVMSKPHAAASVVKVFINGNLKIGEEVILKLANGKPADQQTKSTKVEKPSKIAGAKPVVPALSPPVPSNSDELSEMKARIHMLETRLKDESSERWRFGAIGMVILFSTGIALLPVCRPYLHYFLIGNGVMGAIIIWHLMTNIGLDKSSTKNGTSRGQRR